jgi:hypothetical protein
LVQQLGPSSLLSQLTTNGIMVESIENKSNIIQIV